MFTNETDRMLADGGVMQEGGTRDPVSGNDVPPGAMQEEVRDDIDAKLSEGEFVIPADVVRYIGLSTLMKMRDKAKEGLKKMEDIGQMGNAEEVPDAEALHGGDESEEMDDDSFGAEVDSILGEEEGMPAFAQGGYVDPANERFYKDAPIKGFEMVRMVNAAGNVIYIPHTNGKPMLTVPAGYTPSLSTLPPVAETPTTLGPSRGGVGGGGDGSGGGGGSDGGGGGGGGGGGTTSTDGSTGGGILSGSYGVSFDEQGNVVAGKSPISSGQAMFGGTLLSMLTGLPGLSVAAMGANKLYNKAAEAEAAGLKASIADTMGTNVNTNTAAATFGVSGTGGAAASAAQAAAANAVASGYSDAAVGAAAQAAANAAIGGASADAAAAAGAAAAATVANDIDAANAAAGYAQAAAEAAAITNAQNQAAADAYAAASAAANGGGFFGTFGSEAGPATGLSNEYGSTNETAAADNSGNTSGGSDYGGGGSYSSDNGGSFSSSDSGYGTWAKGGFVSKKDKPVVTKSKKGLASRK